MTAYNPYVYTLNAGLSHSPTSAIAGFIASADLGSTHGKNYPLGNKLGYIINLGYMHKLYSA